RERDSIAGRVDEPAVAEVDPHVSDLGRLRACASVAEEEDVRRLELPERDSQRAGDLPAHLVRRSPLEPRGEGPLARVLLELVHAPDEAGAVEASLRLTSERRLGQLAHASPDVRVADETHRRREDALLP